MIIIITIIIFTEKCYNDGASLSLKEDDGKYFCVVEDEHEYYAGSGEDGMDIMETEYTSYVVPSKPTSDDASCRFTVHKQADKTNLLQASNGNYACRKDSGSVEFSTH